MVGPPHTKAHSGCRSPARWLRVTDPAASLAEVTAPSPRLGAVTAPSLIYPVFTAPGARCLPLTPYLAILAEVTERLARSSLLTRLPPATGAAVATAEMPATAAT